MDRIDALRDYILGKRHYALRRASGIDFGTEFSARGLSPRERQVLDLLMEDYSVGEIAAMLGLGPRNVSQIRQRIIKKMRKNSNKNQCL